MIAVMRDFAFQTGSWRVFHRKLERRLAGSNDWYEFGGTCRAWELLDGAGNVDDHELDDPRGAYRAASLRRWESGTRAWSVWWWDSRLADVGPPVHGTFVDGIGTFRGEDELDGKPIAVRYVWSEITARSARWEQAFSPDRGLTWETNWTMRFERLDG
jgi:hypothetical protein